MIIAIPKLPTQPKMESVPADRGYIRLALTNQHRPQEALKHFQRARELDGRITLPGGRVVPQKAPPETRPFGQDAAMNFRCHVDSSFSVAASSPKFALLISHTIRLAVWKTEYAATLRLCGAPTRDFPR
jgi:hypothetical protein